MSLSERKAVPPHPEHFVFPLLSRTKRKGEARSYGRGPSQRLEAWVEAPLYWRPQSESLTFWTLVYVSMNESVSIIVSIACLSITGLEGRSWRACEPERKS